MAGCRDCMICTRSSFSGCMHSLLAICTLGLVPLMVGMGNMGKKKCPTCGHTLDKHQRRADGSFID